MLELFCCATNQHAGLTRDLRGACCAPLRPVQDTRSGDVLECLSVTEGLNPQALCYQDRDSEESCGLSWEPAGCRGERACCVRAVPRSSRRQAATVASWVAGRLNVVRIYDQT